MITRRRILTKINEEAGGTFVDLGLPSGLLWATGNIIKDTQGNYNIGAETDYGAYFSWGNIEPHFSTDGSTFDDGYNWGNNPDSLYGSTPGGNIIQGKGFTEDSGYDAARELLGDSWKMPIMDDFMELNKNCTSAWVTNYNSSGVAGRLFTSNINGATLFFPAAGHGQGTSLYDYNLRGLYWSCSLYDSIRYGYILFFHSSNVNILYNNRYYGCSVRAVRSAI